MFDEVQKFPKARESIKNLVADGRYDFIETGSLISIREKRGEHCCSLRGGAFAHASSHFPGISRSFRRRRSSRLHSLLLQGERPLDDAFHKRATHLVREYMLVGGMPQAVAAFLEGGRDFYAADEAKRRILDLYRDDIRKAAQRYKSKVSALFEYIPGYLSTHDKKVVLRKVDDGGEFDVYDDPLFWLGDSMMCNLCYRCTDPNVGFALSRDDSAVKCYLADTGLLVSLAFSEGEIASENLYRSIMAGRLSLNEGMLHENLVAQTIAAAGRKLYFYTHYSEQKHRNDIEIDFLLSNDSKTNLKVTPVEVKSSKNYTTLSYAKFKKRFGRRIGSSMVVHPKAFPKTNQV